MPVDRASGLLDRGDRFVVLEIREKTAKSVTVASVSWGKRSYGEWSRETMGRVPPDPRVIAPPAPGYKLPALPSVSCTDDTWAPTTGSGIPDGRFSHTAVWTGSEMIVWGGEYFAGYLGNGGRYDPSTDSWTVSSLYEGSGVNVATPRGNHTAVWTGTEMIVWGGFGNYFFSPSGGRYNPSTDTWAASSLVTGSGANVPEGRYFHVAVWTGSEMIVWGGTNSTGVLNTGGRYDPSTDTWAASSLTSGSGPNVPAPRRSPVTVWTGSEMIVWGGTDEAAALDGGGRYDPSTDTWVLSSLTTGTGANAPPGTVDANAVWTGSEMIVWGGSRGGIFLDTGGRYDPTTDTWAPSALGTSGAADAPSGRSHYAAAWTGSEMIVWGGYLGSGYSGTGGRFNPTTDAWVASSLNTGGGANVPAARGYLAGVWTGTELIVWGGVSSSGLVNTGGRYNPLTDSWAPSSLLSDTAVNLPSSRQRHTAIWTGAEMIVWGGLASTGVTKTGGRYDPAVDCGPRPRSPRAPTRTYPTALLAHRRLDGNRDDRLGWVRTVEHRRTLQPFDGLLGRVIAHHRVGETFPALARTTRQVDRIGDDHLGWV